MGWRIGFFILTRRFPVFGDALRTFFCSVIAASFLASACVQAQATPVRVLGSWDFLRQYKEHEQPFWTKQVPALTAGQLTVDLTPFNQLGLTGTEIIRLLRLGEYDFGSTVLAYGASADVEMEGADLAGLSPDIETAKRVAQAYLPVLDQFFQKKYGIKVLSLWPYPAQVIYCKTRISGLSDLKGKRIRVGTRPIGEFVEALGGVSVNIPFGDAYKALEDSRIDCAITGTLPGNLAKLHRITQYLYPLPVGWSMAMQAANLSYWQSLPVTLQETMQQGINRYTEEIWAATASETQEGINCNIGRQPCVRGELGKMVLLPTTDADRRLLQKLLKETVIPRWATRCGDSCIRAWEQSVGKVLN
ncbi:TRAP transporter substrate-binding protein [Parvibium lacunae]|uniref:ABC transporter substrate-binding protein n=1 Tax=Parvibium lacunae TaxID=1888893 RepID=A0A368L3X8_9BURK|nr:TRAP transporter substrate-binding protein [Parvibium lacunae]RCS58193.1 hypothetical protein DU000_05040 [Parvibium lacunae]